MGSATGGFLVFTGNLEFCFYGSFFTLTFLRYAESASLATAGGPITYLIFKNPRIFGSGSAWMLLSRKRSGFIEGFSGTSVGGNFGIFLGNFNF